MRTTHISEADFQLRITDYCDLLNLKWHHEVDSRRSKSGFPDLVIAGVRGVIFAELKKDDGRVTPEQHEWLDRLNAAGATAVVWRPAEWEIAKADLDWLAGGSDLSRWEQTTRGQNA